MPSVIQLIKLKTPLIPAVTWGFLILYLTLRPKSAGDVISLPSWLAGLPIDKVAHFGFWGIWYGLYAVFFLNRNAFVPSVSPEMNKTSNKREQILGIITLILLGAFIEIAQYLLNWGREAEWADLAANAAGVLVVALFYKRFRRVSA